MDSLAIALGLTNNEKEYLKNSGNCDAVSGLVSYVDENPENNTFSKAAALAICDGKDVDIEDKRINGIKFDSNLPVCLENMILDLMLGNFPYSDSMGNIHLIEEVFSALGGNSFNGNGREYVFTYKTGNISGNGETSHIQWDNTINKYKSTITISNNLVTNGSKLALVKTILHESIHAYLKYLAKKYPASFSDSNGSFSVLLNAYKLHNNQNYAHHTYLAHIITSMATNISNYVQEKYGYPVSTIDYYEAVCWSGVAEIRDPINPGTNTNPNMIEHPLFISNYPNPIDRENIKKIIHTENGTVSYSGYSQLINNNCN